MKWTAEPVELLTKLYAEGLSASQISCEISSAFDTCVSRNSVIGAWTRLGLPSRRNEISHQMTPHTKPSRTLASTGFVHRGTLPVASRSRDEGEPVFTKAGRDRGPPTTRTHVPEEKPEESATIPIEQRCSIFELTESKCRWPVGDPASADFFFCGGKTFDGHPYCERHARIAYVPAGARRAA